MATLKQKRALSKLMENNGKSVSSAMREAGYSLNTSRNPHQLTRSKAWAELLEEYLPDDLLARVHKEGLEAFKFSSSPFSPEEKIPDFAVRHKYLETALEIKNKKEVSNSGSQVIINLIKYGRDNDTVQLQSEDVPTELPSGSTEV